MYFSSTRFPAYPQRHQPAAAHPVARFSSFSSMYSYTEEDYERFAKVTTTVRTGHSTADKIYYNLKTEKPLNASDAYKVQIKKGFHPSRYGFDGFSSIKQPDGSYMTGWSSSTHAY